MKDQLKFFGLFSHTTRINLRGCQSRIVSLVTAPTILIAFNWAKSGRVSLPILEKFSQYNAIDSVF